MKKCICIKDLQLTVDDCRLFKKGEIFNYEFHKDEMATGNRQFVYSIDNVFFTNANRGNFYEYFMDIEKYREYKINQILNG